MRIGTAHFVSKAAAIRYYRAMLFGGAAKAVARKLVEGEIHIGPPKISNGQRVVIIDNGTRYAIEEMQCKSR